MRYDPVVCLKHLARSLRKTGFITIDEGEGLIAETEEKGETDKEQQQVSEVGPLVDGGEVHKTKK